MGSQTGSRSPGTDRERVNLEKRRAVTDSAGLLRLPAGFQQGKEIERSQKGFLVQDQALGIPEVDDLLGASLLV